MLNVLLAITAVLTDVKSVGIVLLIFHGCVVASFASSTSKRDDDAVVLLGQGLNSYACNLRTFSASENATT